MVKARFNLNLMLILSQYCFSQLPESVNLDFMDQFQV